MLINKILENVNMDYLIIRGIGYCIEYCGLVKNNYIKRRDVGYKILDSINGSINETNRKVICDFKSEEFKEDRKGIEFINKK